MIDAAFWKNRRIFITGHTGFKGSWLCLLLDHLGAEVAGYALDPPTDPNLFDICRLRITAQTRIADIRDLETLKRSVTAASPDVVIHMAAQALVRESYADPVETYSTNVMGTVHVLEAIRECKTVKAVVNITTDKCYENREWIWSYREIDRLGGYDPYSSSKACSELATAAYRNSFFSPDRYTLHGKAIASARAGNVIGGGDWAKDRLIPDCIRSAAKKEKLIIRNPEAVRPWQHVLEPLAGYLVLAEQLYKKGPEFGGAWNFGPDEADMRPVQWIAKKIAGSFGVSLQIPRAQKKDQPYEASILKLDSTKSRQLLGWEPRWDIEKSVTQTIDWYREFRDGSNMKKVCSRQIEEYLCSRHGQ